MKPGYEKKQDPTNRLVNQFDVFGIAAQILRLEGTEAFFEKMCGMAGPGSRPPIEMQTDVLIILETLRETCQNHGLLETVQAIALANVNLNARSKVVTAATWENQVRNVKQVVLAELAKRKFLRVADDRTEYLDQPSLFGPDVDQAFPSAGGDVKEAGNCFAAECTTAAVFHLMRAAEIALRSLARDRRITFADKPIEEKEWGQILGKLESVVSELRSAPRSKWTGAAEAREQQIRFYSEATQELRSFNDAWRRHVSHADVAAFYDRNQTASIMEHVRSFMQKLAARISETSVTKEYWTSP